MLFLTRQPLCIRNWQIFTLKLAALDYYLKNHHKGRKLSCTEEATVAAAQPREFLLDGLQKLEQQSYKCVELRREHSHILLFSVQSQRLSLPILAEM
jgi:hypothetical protein